jgi:hypothetical protein
VITLNGRTGAGWRLDEIGGLASADGPAGMDFLMHPFAIAPDKKNADRIISAFNLLGEWRQRPNFATPEDQVVWEKSFMDRIAQVTGS